MLLGTMSQLWMLIYRIHRVDDLPEMMRYINQRRI